MMDAGPVGAGSLKLVVVPEREVADAVEAALRTLVCERDVRCFGECAFLVWTGAEPADLRDRLASSAGSRSLLVVEFERWSSRGPQADVAWLLRRGH